MAVSPLGMSRPAFLGPIQVLSDGRSRCVRALALRLGWCKHGRYTSPRPVRSPAFPVSGAPRGIPVQSASRIDMMY